jgi:hypothetical protein
MTTKTVYTQGAWSIVREMSYGFRCNTATASWSVFFDGKFFCDAPRKKDAMKIIQSNIEVGAPA